MEKRKKWAMKTLSTIGCYLLFRRGAAEADATVSILISAGSSYKDHNFVRKQKERKIKKLSNSYQMMLTMPLPTQIFKMIHCQCRFAEQKQELKLCYYGKKMS
jgi:hypothetical protein